MERCDAAESCAPHATESEVGEVMTARALGPTHRLAANKRSIRAAIILARVRLAVRRFICGLFGHDMLLHFDANRVCLQCFRCGEQTRGWVVDVKPAFRRRRNPVANPRTASSISLAKAS